MTTRPHGVDFRRDAELALQGKGPHDMAIAQLHYTILAHLEVAHGYRANYRLDAVDFTHGIVRLSSATDVADEILGRLTQPGPFDAWSEDAGRNARTARRQAQAQPHDIREFRDYRNRLVHGRVHMSLLDPQTSILFFPRIGHEQTYVDWRTVLHTTARAVINDYASTHDILEDAWRRVLDYIETSWQAIP